MTEKAGSFLATGATEPAPMEGVKRTNAVITCSNQRAEFVPCNPYAIDVDRGNCNCYNCRGFGHLVRNYRNRGMKNRSRKERRLEYGERRMLEGKNKQRSNLNGE